MGKKKFGRVRHAPPRLSDYEARYKPEIIRAHIGATDLYPEEAINRWRREAGHGARVPKGALRPPTTNGPNESVSIMLVLDCIMRLNTTNYVQAGGLTQLLQSEYPYIIWDPVTVGKILASLYEITADAAPDKDNLPLGQATFGGASMYAVSEDTEAWKYLGALRDAIGHRVRNEIAEALASNTMPERSPTVWDDLGQVAWTDRANG